MKWLGVAVLVIIGVIAAIFAIEYLTVPIRNLPSWVPGHQHVLGRYHKRGDLAALVAVVAFVAAGIWGVRIRREGQVAAAPSSAGDLLASPASTPDGAPSSE